MEAIKPFKQLIQRKQKHYKLAIGDHLDTLHKALDRDTRERLQTLAQRSIIISAPDTDNNETIIGFTVADLPGSKVNERVFLIESDTKQRVAEGSIVGVNQRQEVKIKLNKPLSIRGESESSCSQASVYKIKFDNEDILNRKKRIENALLKFKHVSCSLPLHKSLLGNYKDWSNKKYNRARAISLSDSLRLKGSQVKAVEESMKKRISLIEGVAGSGKTVVAASLAYSIHRFKNKKVLLCSPIQATVDRLAQMLNENESVIVVKLTEERKCLFSEDNCSSKESSYHHQDPESCSLNSLIKSEIFEIGWQRTRKAYNIPRGCPNHQSLLNKQANRLVNNSSTWLKKQVERKILRNADIICCTLIQAGSPCLTGLRFDMLIIDDLQAASETDCMIAMMVKGLKQITLISEMRKEIRTARSRRQSVDIKCNGKISSMRANGLKEAAIKKQAGELVVKQAQEPGGLFERWLSMGLTAVALRNQFRMHETLAAFSNHHFYLSRSKTDKEANEELTKQFCNNIELSDDRFKWLPNNRCPTAFFDTRAHGSSIDETAKSIIDKLVSDENVDKSRIGIIMNKHLDVGKNFDGIDIGTVEDFQGQERDFIILLAKYNDDTTENLEKPITTIECDYLKDDYALLIAITRARLGQFIVTEVFDDNIFNCQTSTALKVAASSDINKTDYCDSWKALVRYYHANKLVIHVPASGF